MDWVWVVAVVIAWVVYESIKAMEFYLYGFDFEDEDEEEVK